MPELHEDRALLDAYRRGEPAALAAIYDSYAARVVSVLRAGFSFDSGERVLRFRGFAEPLELESFVQEVFVRVFAPRARSAYDGLRPFEPYVLQITRNLVIDELRRRKRELERVVGPVEEESAAEVPESASPEARLDTARASELVRRFLAERSESERRWVEARFARDLPLLAAAREAGITRMRARVMEARLLADLCRALRRAGYLESGGAGSALALLMVVV